jgi:glycerol-3-phosphate acyltransferase PlsY
MVPDAWLLLVGAYLFGAIPFGLLLGKYVGGVDVRQAGSGNIGATNVARSAGKGLGIVTLLLDAMKGAAPVLVAEHVLDLPIEIAAAAGVASVIGHVFPVYLRFRGGKGVATGLGIFLALSPRATLAAALAFGLVFGLTRLVSPGSLAGAAALVGAILWLDEPRAVLVAAVFVTALIFVRHTGNIRRLLAKTENRV